MSSPIPPITDEMGRHWEQPNHENFLFDDTHVLMTRKDFQKLSDYSCSMPSGVYEGKMWRATPSKFFREAPKHDYLRWYGPSDLPDHVSNNQRIVLFIDDEVSTNV